MENLIRIDMQPSPINKLVISESKLTSHTSSQTPNLPRLLAITTDHIFQYKVKRKFQDQYTITFVRDADEAGQLLNQISPDAFIFDEARQHSDGIDLIKGIRKKAGTKHAVFIFVTKENSNADELKLLNSGADEILKKSVDFELFDLKLNRLIYYKQSLKSNTDHVSLTEPDYTDYVHGDETFLKNLVSLIEDHIGNSNFNVETIVREVGVSRSKLYSKLKELTGMSSTQFVRHIRIKKAMMHMRKGSYTIKEIRNMSGFKSDSYFTKCFKKEFGEVPYKYLQKFRKSRKFTVV